MSHPRLTTKRRVERSLPAAMFEVITIGLVTFWCDLHGVEEAAKMPKVVKVAVLSDLFRQAAAEPFADLPRLERRKRVAQRDRMLNEAMAPFADRPAVTAYRALVTWVQLLHDELEVLEVGGGSPFYGAFTELATIMEASADDLLDDVERSAGKACQRLQAWFEGRGYFVPRRVAA